MSKTVSIAQIEVGERARVDLGDLTDLMQSIKALGLLQPIVITAEHKLIAGQRRLESHRRLGRTEIAVVVVESITDAVDLLKAERDENTCRKPMTASELIAQGRKIEELERPLAAERVREGQKLRRAAESNSVPTNGITRSDRYDSREKAAEAVGLSTATYSRIKQVANAADGYEMDRGQRTEVTPERQTESKEALALMDRITGGEEVRPADGGRPLTVTAVYEQWKGHKVNRGEEAPAERRRQPAVAVAAPQVAPLRDSRGRRFPQRSLQKALTESIATFTGLCAGWSGITDLGDSLDAEEVAQWTRDLDRGLRVVRSLNNKLKEHNHGKH